MYVRAQCTWFEVGGVTGVCWGRQLFGGGGVCVRARARGGWGGGGHAQFEPGDRCVLGEGSCWGGGAACPSRARQLAGEQTIHAT